jgi:ubiquinone/menaquinone biosynthesis C-methylase UbiE
MKDQDDYRESIVRREYDRLAHYYDERWRHYIDGSLNAVLAGLQLQGHERVLDVPCGTGELPQRLLQRWPNLDLIGVDISPGMLAQAREKVDNEQVTLVEASVSELPFSDNEFDCVICANSFHYFPEPEKAILEMRRVLNPNGKLVLVDWCDDYISCKLCGLWLRWTDPAFHQIYAIRTCQRFASQAGLEVVTADRFRVNFLWGMMRLVSCPTS